MEFQSGERGYSGDSGSLLMRVRRWSERRCTKAMLSGRSDVGWADHDVVEARTAETDVGEGTVGTPPTS